jgi:hypothetical protein
MVRPTSFLSLLDTEGTVAEHHWSVAAILLAPAQLALRAVGPRVGVRRHTVVVWMLVASTVTASGAGAIIR